jgi:spore maturation protein CgeB
VQNKILNQTQMSAIFSSSRVNLNLLTHENNDFTNLRLFEVPASGGLLLTERNPCASQYLIDGEECLMFSSVDEVNSTLNQGCQQNFDRIARAGFKRIRVQENSFSGRVDTLLLFLECRP